MLLRMLTVSALALASSLSVQKMPPMRTVWTLTLIQIAQLLLFFRKTLTKKQDLFKSFLPRPLALAALALGASALSAFSAF